MRSLNPPAAATTLLVCAGLFSSISLPALAQEFRTFIGAPSTLWENKENWNPDDVPDSPREGAHIEVGNVVVGGNHIIHTLELAGAGGLALSQNNILTASSLVYDGTGTVFGPGTLLMNNSGTINSAPSRERPSATRGR